MPGGRPDEDGIGLAEMITTLRAELLKAQQDPTSKDLELVTGPVELKLEVAITRTKQGRGGVKFWVVDVGGGAERAAATTHTFTIVLDPIDPSTGKSAKVSHRSRRPASRD